MNIDLKKLSQKQKDEFFMGKALEEAQIALEYSDWPIGCVVVLNDKIISKGRNKVYSLKNKIHHAEIEALNKASKILSKDGEQATLYTTYEPCPMCVGAILLNHIGRIVYGPDLDGSGGIYLINNKPKRFTEPRYSITLTSGVLNKECSILFKKGKPTQKIISIIKNK
jgi:tRNA(adenine34) deaminase